MKRFVTARPFTDTDMSSDINSDILKTETASISNWQFNWEGVTGTGGALKIEGSNDGVNYIDTSITPPTISGASGTGSIIIPQDFQCWRFMRVAYTAGSVTAGTLNAYVHLKDL